MARKTKGILLAGIVVYIIGLIYAIILLDLDIMDLITNPNIEKILFLTYNVYIIVYAILLGLNKIKSTNAKYKFCICTIVYYLILQIVYFGQQAYRVLVRYNLDDEEIKRIIGSSLIRPAGLLPNILLILIVLQLSIMIWDESKK
ncbi:MAG: hypothetical protein MJB12_11380 [Firmicutes bacterium]|nr:hypothetical protein [Bacillota bacterium]